ncbi:serine/threonine protein kinase [Aspergillus ibericus CBS 121593]|uniref:Serine/threonine protein kinase n=1 Tax=Aspergillus ibericus CBS 121593 TaxID=1448316 RepID=A0A395HIM5_9EURO|nr:serine/threonine protein kinase [Aspergillus ibericus CBS 121593]RAL06114.1 serine/threonine protein kinase [Aspergillus ibericus CBS 121593]
MASSLIGNRNTYIVTKKLSEYFWLAKYERSLHSTLIESHSTNRSKSEQTVLIKSARHPHIANERNVLKKFQSHTASLRPLVDEIKEPDDPPAIVLKYLDDDLLKASAAKRLTIPEIKYVSKKILEGLKVLHDSGYVHTDIKLDNVLVNYGLESRFTDVQLADLESTVHTESRLCINRDEIGTPIWRSPEAQLGLQWGPPTDIWSFGTMVSHLPPQLVHLLIYISKLISLIWGDNFFIFKPDVPRSSEDYELKILIKYHIFFGPYPSSYSDLADEETLEILSWIKSAIPPTAMKPFSRASRREISEEDKNFICKIMKLDPRDRPTANELLDAEWFYGILICNDGRMRLYYVHRVMCF